MMMTKYLTSIFVAVTLLVLAGCRLTPVQNIQDQPIPAGLTLAQIEKSIINAGFKRGWLMSVKSQGKLQGKLMVRSHVVVVDINYNPTSYSIAYNSSENMNYSNGKIHQKYNQWVANLSSDIHLALHQQAL